MDESLYFKNGKPRKHPKSTKKIKAVIVDEPAPIVKEDLYGMGNQAKIDCCLEEGMDKKDIGGKPRYDPPLPTSIVKEADETITSNSEDESTCEIYNADCLEKMKDLPDKSIDLIFCDLPYGQTSCKWDCPIDLELFWEQVMRIKKLNTPIFMTTTTKFGVSLINSAPKKCFFRYDIVWVKSAPAGFLSAKKMPMRKHEMIYVFYEKLPFYDLSSHKHKFIKHKENTAEESKTDTYGKLKRCPNGKVGQYDPPLPVSVVKETIIKDTKFGTNTYDTEKRNKPIMRQSSEAQYEPPLPVSVVKEGEMIKDFTDNKNGNIYDCPDNQEFKGRNGQPRYEPPLPVSVVKEEYNTKEGIIYNGGKPLPINDYSSNGRKGSESAYEPPLPTTMLEVKSTRGKHSTEKPVELMSWILKYYSKEGDVILDPTMGSGSTGVSCKNMNRKFIGIEMDKQIYESAKSRLEL